MRKCGKAQQFPVSILSYTLVVFELFVYASVCMCVVEVKEHRQRSPDISKGVLNSTIELNFLVGNYFRYTLNYCLSTPSLLFSYKQNGKTICPVLLSRSLGIILDHLLP